MAATLVRSARLGSSRCSHVSKSLRLTTPWNHSLSRLFRVSSVAQDASSIKMPSLSPTMTQGNIVKWYKKEGEAFAAGDVLCDIETDKAVVSFDIEEDGILAKIIKPENSKDVQIGTLIAVFVEEGEDWQNAEIPPVDSSSESSSDSSSSSSNDESESAVNKAATQTFQLVSSGQSFGPAVRTLLELYHLQPQDIPATGPHSRLLKGDVLKHVKANNLKPAPQVATPVSKPETPPTPSQAPPTQPVTPPPAVVSQKAAEPAPPTAPPGEVGTYTDIDLTNMRQIIAKRLTESKTTIPHAYASIDCPVGEVLKLRKKFAEDGVKVSVNDFIIKAAAIALQSVPEVNCLWDGEGPKLLTSIDISVAVATDSGLITPIVKDAVSLGLEEISNNVKDLATRARAGKLALHEFQGGSFTISNLGMFGITEFSAVINPPQACILAVGGSRIVLNEDCEPCPVFAVTLSSDSRIVDDATASKFLETFREVIENPMLMLSQTNTILQRIKAGLA